MLQLQVGGYMVVTWWLHGGYVTCIGAICCSQVHMCNHHKKMPHEAPPPSVPVVVVVVVVGGGGGGGAWTSAATSW